MTAERRKAIWAIYGMCDQIRLHTHCYFSFSSETCFGIDNYSLCIAVWCRRTDELVDGPNASHITPGALDRWEQRLSDVFEGRPYDMYDAALSHTVSKYPVDIQVLYMPKSKHYTILGQTLHKKFFS